LSEPARELFALPPEEFIAARDRLAAELKDAGKADEATEVKKLRRPSIVAWAVNAASREGADEVAALREAGQELRRAQRKTLSGGGGEDLRAATDARRALIQTLADAGVRAIGARGGAHRDAIAATFDAASVDDELGERLQAGTLEREARPTAGFGAIEGFEVLQGGGSEDDDDSTEEDPAQATMLGRRSFFTSAASSVFPASFSSAARRSRAATKSSGGSANNPRATSGIPRALRILLRIRHR